MAVQRIKRIVDLNTVTSPPLGSVIHVTLPDTEADRDRIEPLEDLKETLGVNNLAGAGRTTETVKGNADDISDLAGAGRTTETVKGNADAISGLAAIISSSRIVNADSDQTVTISLGDGITTIYCTSAINTLTLAKDTGDDAPNERNIIRVINNTAGPLTVTDSTTTFTMIDQQAADCWWMAGTLKRGPRVYIASGNIDPRDRYSGEIFAAGTTEATVWNAVSPFIPDTGDKIMANGIYNGVPVLTTFTRTDATTITMNGQAGGTFYSETIRADGSGSFATNELAVSW